MAFILRHVCARADAASGERYGRINRNNSGGRVSNDQGMRWWESVGGGGGAGYLCMNDKIMYKA